jgi:hypothetical protein
MEAFNLLVNVTCAAGTSASWLDTELSTLVPAGKQLVVEFISTSSQMPAGQRPNPGIVVLKNGVNAVVQHYLVTFFQLNLGADSNILGVSEGGRDIYQSADPVRMILSRDLTLRADFVRNSVEDTAYCSFGISGHIERIPFPALSFFSSFVGGRS